MNNRQVLPEITLYDSRLGILGMANANWDEADFLFKTDGGFVPRRGVAPGRYARSQDQQLIRPTPSDIPT